MTSDLGVERVEEFLFHCYCGATIKTSDKKETCRDCGAYIEIVSHVPTREGEKYKLRIKKHPWDIEPLLWPPVLQSVTPTHVTSERRTTPEAPGYSVQFRSMATTHPTWRPYAAPDFDKRCVQLGLLILLAPIYLPLLLAFLVFLGAVFAPPPTVQQDRPHDRAGQAQQLRR